MNTERAQAGWGFWLWWVLASTVVPSLVVAIVLVIYESLPDSDPQQQLLAALWGLVLVLVLATITISQWLVLRRQIPRAGWWVVAGIGGLVVGSLVGLVAGGAVGFGADVISRAALLSADSTFGLAVGLLVSLAVGMPSALVTITIAQWLVLRSHVSRAGWWLLVPNGFLLLGIGWLVVLTTLSGTIGAILGAVVINSLGIVVYGAVSGGVMVWLLRQPATEEPSLSQDAAKPEGGGMKRWVWALIGAGGLTLILFLTALAIQGRPDAQPITEPVAVIEAFHEALNDGDIEAAMNFVADDARFKFINLDSGKAEIKDFYNEGLAYGYHAELSDLRADDDKVSWMQKLTISTGVLEDSFEAVVQEGLIVSLFLTDDPNPLKDLGPFVPTVPEPTGITDVNALVGSYRVQGTNPDGSTYKGELQITTTADGQIKIHWLIAGQEYVGGGRVTEDGQLYVQYEGPFEGDGTWRLMENGDLHGTWQGAGSSDKGSENWTKE